MEANTSFHCEAEVLVKDLVVPLTPPYLTDVGFA